MTNKTLGFYFLPIGLAMALAGCMAGGQYSKEEARSVEGRTPEGDDICDLEGWYDDDVCDDFCPEVDPACATCTAVPTCNVGETEHASVSECPADASCREVTVCGASIWCSDTATCTGVPSCDEGEIEHATESECFADAACREVNVCGAIIWCSFFPEVTCRGPNPEGCVSTGCESGFHCDTTMGSRPSACECTPKGGVWECTADLSGGICVAD